MSAHTFHLPEHWLALALLGKYVTLTLYGFSAAVVEVPTFAIVAGSTFAFTWAIAVGTLAAFAAAGVAHSWRTGREGLERWSSAAFVCVFLSYSSVLIFRAVTTGDYASAPLSLIPVGFCILPTIRYFSIVRRSGRERIA